MLGKSWLKLPRRSAGATAGLRLPRLCLGQGAINGQVPHSPLDERLYQRIALREAGRSDGEASHGIYGFVFWLPWSTSGAEKRVLQEAASRVPAPRRKHVLAASQDGGQEAADKCCFAIFGDYISDSNGCTAMNNLAVELSHRMLALRHL